MKKGLLFLMLSVLCIGQAMADPIEAVPVDNISVYHGTAAYVHSSADGKFYARNTLGNYEEYGVYERVTSQPSLSDVTVYEGKMFYDTTNGKVYEYTGSSFEERGTATMEAITDTDYKNMKNWRCPDDHWSSVFDSGNKINYDVTAGTNSINPYVGTGGWEPLHRTINVTAGQDYNVSFKYSTGGWTTWNTSHTETPDPLSLPFKIIDRESYNQNNGKYTDAGLIASAKLPNSETDKQQISVDFRSSTNIARFIIQFGVVDDGTHDPAYWFSFDNWEIKKYIYPKNYAEIVVGEDPNKYTPLEYIESTGAALNNPFTLPYIPITATQINTKFKVYDTSSGWCAIFCARNTHAGTGISLYMNGNKSNFGYFTGGTTGAGDAFAPFSVNTDYVVTADVTKLVVNGTEYPTGNTTTNATSRKLSLFSNPEWDNPMRGCFYYFTIKEGEDTKYEFKPVMRHDGKFGFYDATTQAFVEPVQYNWTGYGYKKFDDKAYMTYSPETRIVLVGNTAQFLPDVQNLNGATFTWTSSDETKATVAADGTVTGIGAGTVTITVSTEADEGWTASYELTVSEPTYVRRDANNVGYAIVTGGSNTWNDSPLSGLLDKDARTKMGCSNASDAWAIIIASEPVAVQQYSFVTGGDTYSNPGRTPRSWKLEGSNDNHTWTTIDEQTQNYKAKTSNNEETVFSVNGTDTYKFFKFTVIDVDGGFQLGEFWINEQSHTWGEPTETPSTCIVQGKKVWECSDCHTLKTEALPLAAHTYTNDVCTVCSTGVSTPILLANGQTNPYTVKFRHMTGSDNNVDIETNWNTAAFDDSAWDELLMPIGTGGVYKTRWLKEHNTFWFRRTFSLTNPSVISGLTLKVLHDDDYAVFINGVKVKEATGWTTDTNWETIEIEPADVNLVAGTNVVAIYIEQNTGGAYCDFSLEAEIAAPATIGEANFTTFVAPFNIAGLPSGVEAYACQVQTNSVHLEQVTAIPEGSAVVLKNTGSYTFSPTASSVELGTTNDLKASDGTVTGAVGNIYALAKKGNPAAVGFYLVGSSVTVPAGKGYLQIGSGSGVKAFYGFDDDDATGISLMEDGRSQMEDGAIYNVAGQMVNGKSVNGKLPKGIYIVNGKKILK